jgi:hypothetical protein
MDLFGQFSGLEVWEMKKGNSPKWSKLIQSTGDSGNQLLTNGQVIQKTAARDVDEDYFDLFQAAPDLYKALDKLVADYHDWLGASEAGKSEILKECHAALAKARGES